MRTKCTRILLILLCGLFIVLGSGCENKPSAQDVLEGDVTQAINSYISQKELLGSFGDVIMPTSKNIIAPHVLVNGKTAYYVGDSGALNMLHANDKVEVTIIADCDYFGSNGNTQFGYALANQIQIIEEVKLDKETKISVTIDADGEYAFYLTCTASDPIVIKSIKFEIIENEG